MALIKVCLVVIVFICINCRPLLLKSSMSTYPQDAASTIAIQKASVREVLRKMSP